MNNLISKTRFVTLGLAVAFLPFSLRFCHLSLFLFLIACIAEGDFANKGRTIAQNPLAWILPAFFLVYVLGVFYSDNVSNGWTNVDKKIAFVVAPLIIISAKPFTKEEINRLMWIFVGACVLATIICTYTLFANPAAEWRLGPEEPYRLLHPGASNLWPYISYIQLAAGIGMHPTYFAFYLFVSILIVLKTIDNKWLSIALVIYLLIFIVMLSSRVVVLIAGATLLIAASQKKILLAAVAVMIAAILLNPVALYRNIQEYTHAKITLPPASMSDNALSIRTSLLWLSAKAMTEINPLIGTGTGDVESEIGLQADKYAVHNVLNTSDPHNQFVHTFIALGAVGLLTLLAVFIIPLMMLYRQREFLACAGIIGFMVVCMTESALELQKGIVLFTLVISLAGNRLREFRFSNQRLKYA